METLLTGNITYNKYIERWRFLMHSFTGGMEYRNAGYLTRYQLETDKEYNARCEATPLDNHCKSIIQIYNSFLFRQDIERELGPLENLPDVQDFLDDADLDGRTLDNFMKEVSSWAQVFGHCWVIMTKPNIQAQSLAEEQLLGIRPYVSLLTPMTVLDWKWERDITGRYQLSYFKYIEEINGSVHTLKEWTKDAITTTIYDANTRISSEEITETNGLGIIPAIVAYSDRTIIRGIGVSAIDDIADLQRYIYNAISEADQSIRLDSHPSLVATEETQIGTGAGSIIQIPTNQDPGLNPYVLDFNGASISSIYEVINNTTTAIERAACIGGIRAKETRTLSGVALETEFQTLNNRLSSIADNLEDAEEQLWDLFCLYQQYPDCIEISYPNTFDIKDDDRTIEQLVTAKQAATDPRVLAAIDVEILDWLELDSDEIIAMLDTNIIDLEAIPEGEDFMVYEPITMINPITSEQVITTDAQNQLDLAKNGWIILDES